MYRSYALVQNPQNEFIKLLYVPLDGARQATVHVSEQKLLRIVHVYDD